MGRKSARHEASRNLAIARDLISFVGLARYENMPANSLAYGHRRLLEIARALAGRPRAQRAAGTFCARNRLAIFIPCHRVVGSDGIGSYGSLGVEYKRRLLPLDGKAL